VWNEGDLILLDNRRLLHGREAFRGERALANLQVRAA
jgi:alpha-ketoglutarate-dependent taurine dioxygenase